VTRCELCGEWFDGYGHNPEPLADFEEGRCCDICNDTKVIPARLAAMVEVMQVEEARASVALDGDTYSFESNDPIVTEDLGSVPCPPEDES
jgi:hypothetical protein